MSAHGPDDGGVFYWRELAALMDEEATHTLHKYSFSACRQPKCCLLIVFSASGQYYPSFFLVKKISRETAAFGDERGFSCLGGKLVFLSVFVSVQVNQHCLFLFRLRKENHLFCENRGAARFFWNEKTSSRLLKLRNSFICLQVEIKKYI